MAPAPKQQRRDHWAPERRRHLNVKGDLCTGHVMWSFENAAIVRHADLPSGAVGAPKAGGDGGISAVPAWPSRGRHCRWARKADAFGAVVSARPKGAEAGSGHRHPLPSCFRARPQGRGSRVHRHSYLPVDGARPGRRLGADDHAGPTAAMAERAAAAGRFPRATTLVRAIHRIPPSRRLQRFGSFARRTLASAQEVAWEPTSMPATSAANALPRCIAMTSSEATWAVQKCAERCAAPPPPSSLLLLPRLFFRPALPSHCSPGSAFRFSIFGDLACLPLGRPLPPTSAASLRPRPRRPRLRPGRHSCCGVL